MTGSPGAACTPSTAGTPQDGNQHPELSVPHFPGAQQGHFSGKLGPESFGELIPVPRHAGPQQLLPWLFHWSAFHQGDAASAELSLARVLWE